jgi:hypothetical protein
LGKPINRRLHANSQRRSLAPLGCAVLAIVAYGLLVGPNLISKGPSWFIHVGRLDKDPPTLKQVKQILGNDVSVTTNYGHDGREFWVLARDPLLFSAGRDARLLDLPAYRAARIAYPAAAAPWRSFGESSLLLGLLVTNLIVVGVGSYFTALFALHIRAPLMTTAFFGASPVVAVAVLLDLGDAMSLAALIASVYLFTRGRFGWGTAMGVVAVLAKQPALLAMAAVAATAPSVSRNRRIMYVMVPTLILIVWTAYVTVRLDASGAGLVGFGLPLLGYRDALPYWVRHHLWPDAALGLALLPAAAAVIVRWWKRRTTLLVAALPFALMVPFFSFPVVTAAINSLRAFGPALTFFGLDWFENRRGVTQERQPSTVTLASRGSAAGR